MTARTVTIPGVRAAPIHVRAQDTVAIAGKDVSPAMLDLFSIAGCTYDDAWVARFTTVCIAEGRLDIYRYVMAELRP